MEKSLVPHEFDTRNPRISGVCGYVTDHTARLKILEEQYKIVGQHTEIVNKLSTKVTLLLTIMTATLAIAAAGVVYTFTGVNEFKDIYTKDKIEFKTQLISSVADIEKSMNANLIAIEKNLDKRMDGIERRVIMMEKGDK